MTCMSTLKKLQTYLCHNLWVSLVTYNLFHESILFFWDRKSNLPFLYPEYVGQEYQKASF